MANKYKDDMYRLYKSIKRNPFKRIRFINALKKVMQECGDELLPGTKTKAVLDVFIHQGYWCGVVCNYYFNDDYGYDFDVKKRRFGR